MRVIVLGAGGAASNGFCRALKLVGGYDLIGTNANPTDLLLSECDENHVIPHVSDRDAWNTALDKVIRKTRPDFAHAQNDAEVEALARLRKVVHLHGCKTYLPSVDAIVTCRDKMLSYRAWRDAGVPVPETMLTEGRGVLHGMLSTYDEVWLRPRTGAGGQRSLRTSSGEMAAAWLNHHDGWGEFTVAEALTADTVTVQQLYWQGTLICSQQRTRESWANSGSSATGVSGSTGVGVTSSDPVADDVADEAVAAVDETPHGLYGVDMVRDRSGFPAVTEINIGRFFTTASEMYAQAGFNMADYYVRFGTDSTLAARRTLTPARNPLPDGVRWLRVMDKAPVLDRVPVPA